MTRSGLLGRQARTRYTYMQANIHALKKKSISLLKFEPRNDTYNPSIWEAESGGSRIQGQSEYSKIGSQKEAHLFLEGYLLSLCLLKVIINEVFALPVC